MGNDPSRRTSTQEVKLPPWLESASQNAIGASQNFFNQPYQPYGGERVAPMSQDTLNAQADLRNTSAPGASNERIVDENGRLGSISSYMNPYTNAVLDPALRNMNTVFNQERNRLGNMRQRAGAYGDARHGVAESVLGQNYETAVGDVTGRTYSDAYNQAMGLRGNDLSRFFQGDQTNFQNQLGLIQAKMGSGMLTQQQGQNQLDTDYEAYTRQQQDAYDKLAALIGATGGVPYGSQQTNVAAQGYPFLQALGSIFGALAGNASLFGGGG